MRRRVWLCVLLALSGPEAAAQQVVFLKNGDRLSGRIARTTDSTWVLEVYGTNVGLPPAGIAGLVSDDPIGLRLSDGTLVAATVGVAAGDSLRLVFADGTDRVVPIAAVEALGRAGNLDALRPLRVGRFWPIWRFWRATGGAGFSDKSGNSRARGFSVSLDLERKTARDRITAGASLNREATQPAGGPFETTVEKYFAHLRGDVYLSPAFFLFAQTQQERDRFQDLALHSTYTGGLGLQVASTSQTDLRSWTSTGLRRQAFIAGGTEHAAVGILGYALTQRIGPATLAWRVEGTSNLEALADSRLRSEATLTLAVLGGLGVRLGAVNEYNHRPRPGVQRHDMLVSTTLTYTLGR